jgi:hypothetical protein
METAFRRTVAVIAALIIAATFIVVAAGCGNQPGTTVTTSSPATQNDTSSQSSASPTTTATVAGQTTTSAAALTTSTSALATSSTGSSTTGSTTTGSTEALSSAEKTLPNGHIQAMGFIKKVWVESGKRKLEIDYVDMLTGEEAVKAAIADGLIKPGETLDNDYYIRNQNKTMRTFAVADTAKIVIAPSATEEPVTWAVFAGYWTGTSSEAKMMRNVPWWIERDGATVVEVKQQYLP